VYRALLSVCRTLLSVCRALFRVYEGVLSVYRALLVLRVYKGGWSVCRGSFKGVYGGFECV